MTISHWHEEPISKAHDRDAFDRTPELIRHGFARHGAPVFRLARLAVDRSIQRTRNSLGRRVPVGHWFSFLTEVLFDYMFVSNYQK